MTIRPIAAAAVICALYLPGPPASAQHQVRVAQNVAYVICVPKTGTAGQCVVKEPVSPCPAPSVQASPSKMYGSLRQACEDARKLQACRSLSGC
jgi:hypothetical protein